MDKKRLFLILGMFICLCTGFFLFGIHFGYGMYTNSFYEVGKSDKIPSTMEEIIYNCNTTLLESSECIAKNINSFYFYKESVDFPFLDFQILKEEGGDCYDYSILVSNIGGHLGFYNYTFNIQNEELEWHKFAILSNEDGKCIFNTLKKELSVVCYTR
jgi:hypothetical protein